MVSAFAHGTRSESAGCRRAGQATALFSGQRHPGEMSGVMMMSTIRRGVLYRIEASTETGLHWFNAAFAESRGAATGVGG
jgi:hypothetical protein